MIDSLVKDLKYAARSFCKTPGLSITIVLSIGLGIDSTDAVTFAAVPAVLSAVALVAVYLPARCATRVAPVSAFRYE